MIHRPENAVLLDAMISKYQDRLSVLPWLNEIYGKCVRLSDHQNIKPNKFYRFKDSIFCPGWPLVNNEYDYIGPRDDIGSHSFFDAHKGQYRIERKGDLYYVDAVVDLIVMFNYDEVYAADSHKYTVDNVKSLVLDAMGRGPLYIETAERSEDVFRSFGLDEITSRFMMRPWDAFRITMKLIGNNLKCN